MKATFTADLPASLRQNVLIPHEVSKIGTAAKYCPGRSQGMRTGFDADC
jgi:hypothetical protein